MPDSPGIRGVLSFSEIRWSRKKGNFSHRDRDRIRFILHSFNDDDDKEGARVCSTQKYSVIVIAREIVRITLVRVQTYHSLRVI